MKPVLYLIPVLLIVSACTALKGYPGPELPDTELALLVFNSGGDHEISYANTLVDNYQMDTYNRRIKLKPGAHTSTFDWSFQTADEDQNSGALMSWKKFGNCKIDFSLKANEIYNISARTESSGTFVSDPQIYVKVTKNCNGFMCQPEIIAKGECVYTGRTPSGMLNIDLSK